MTVDHWDLERQALAAEGLTAAAAYHALTRVAELGRDPPTRVGLMEMYRLTALTRRIESRLEAGQDALDRGDVDSACLEWAGALVLTDKLAAIETKAKLVHHRHHQKSGSTG